MYYFQNILISWFVYNSNQIFWWQVKYCLSHNIFHILLFSGKAGPLVHPGISSEDSTEEEVMSLEAFSGLPAVNQLFTRIATSCVTIRALVTVLLGNATETASTLLVFTEGHRRGFPASTRSDAAVFMMVCIVVVWGSTRSPQMTPI